MQLAVKERCERCTTKHPGKPCMPLRSLATSTYSLSLSLHGFVLKRALRDSRHEMRTCAEAALDLRHPDELRLARSCSTCTLPDCQKAVTSLLGQTSVAWTRCTAHWVCSSPCRRRQRAETLGCPQSQTALAHSSIVSPLDPLVCRLHVQPLLGTQSVARLISLHGGWARHRLVKGCDNTRRKQHDVFWCIGVWRAPSIMLASTQKSCSTYCD